MTDANNTGSGSLYATPFGAHEAPTIRAYRQLPVSVPLVEWNVDAVYGAINAHENGLFQQSSILHDAMMRDDRYAGCMQTRVQTAVGVGRLIKLGEKSDAEEARVALEQEAPSMMPRGVRAQLREWCIGLGFSVAQIVKQYDETTDRWHWVLEPWHPSYIYYRLDIDSYQLISYGGIVDIGHGIPGKFVVFEPKGRRSWLDGTVRSLGLTFLGRSYALQRDWPRLLELYALGIRKAIVPPDADIKKKGPFLRQVNALGAETTIVVEQGSEAGDPKYDLEILAPPVQNNGQAFDAYVDRIDNNIAIRMLGVNLTTKASAKSSSGAAADAQSDIQGEIIASDLATDAETETAMVFRPWVAEHYGAQAAAEISSEYGTEKKKAQASRIDAIAQLAPQLSALSEAGVDTGELLRDLDMPMRPDAPTLPAAPATPGTPAAPGAQPAAPAQSPAPSVPQAHALARDTVGSPKLRHALHAQEILDGWHSDGASSAAAPLQEFAARIENAAQSATGFDDLRQTVLALYAKRAVSRDLVDTVHAARLRARLLGRLAVVREGATNGGTGRRRIGRGAAQER